VSDVRIHPEGAEDQAFSFEVERQACERLLQAEIVEQVRELAGSLAFAAEEDGRIVGTRPPDEPVEGRFQAP
jgi:hypothetical protein